MLRIFWIVLLLPLALSGQATLTVSTSVTSLPPGYTDILVLNGGDLSVPSISGFNTITVNLGGVISAAAISCNSLTVGGELNVTNTLAVSSVTSFSNASEMQATSATLQLGSLSMTGNCILTFSNSDVLISGSIDQDGGRMILLNASELSVNGAYESSGLSSLEMSSGSKVFCGNDFNNQTGYSFLPVTNQADFTFNASFVQNIDGFNKFYNLTLSGGNKTVFNTGSTEVTNVLDIGNELVETNQELIISNGSTSSLLVSGGYFSCSGANGKLTRNTATTDAYLFPIGSNDDDYDYRPMIVVPANSPGQFSSKLIVGTLPHPFTEVGKGLLKVNKYYYHRFYNSINATVYGFYDKLVDEEEWNTLASWPTSEWSIISDVPILKNGFQYPITTGPYLVSLQYDGIGVELTTSQSQDIVFGKTLLLKEASDPSYSVLKKNVDGGYHLPNRDTLYFKFDEDYTVKSNESLKYKILNSQNVVVGSSSFLFPSIVSVGDNRFKYYTASLAVGVYLLEVSNSKGDKWFIRFKK